MTTLTGFQLPEPLIPGSEPWLATTSASQLCQITGSAPKKWGTRNSLWHEKRGTLPAEPQSKDMSRGHEFEPLIRRWFAEANPQWVVEETSTWRHLEREWQTADPDGVIRDPADPESLELFEAKTVDDIRSWESGIPDYYMDQCQWQMDTIGARRVHLAACGPFELFHRSPKVFVVDYDPEYVAALHVAVRNFNDSLVLGFEPEPDWASPRDRLALRYKAPHIADQPVEVSDSIALDWLAFKAREVEKDTRGEVAVSKMLREAGDCKQIFWQGVHIASRQKGRNGQPPILVAAKGIKDQAAELIAAHQNGVAA